MNETQPHEPLMPQKAFTAFYSGEDELFVVDFTGTFPFADSARKVHARNGMFTHGISTDGDKFVDGSGYAAFNKIAITEKHIPSDSLPEGLAYRLSQAASKLSKMYEGAPKESAGCTGQLRCEKAAQLINRHQEQIIAELILSYTDYKREGRAEGENL